MLSLADIWLAILALLLYFYIVTDGFDFGVGILTLVNPVPAERVTMAYTIESVWHANQTWLVIAGGVLFGAFPMVYGSVLSAMYLPLGLLLFSLMMRGVALEYSAHSQNKALALFLFGVGSLLSAFFEGVILGGVIQGVPLVDGEYMGSAFGWLRPFPILLGATVCAVDILLGGCWLAIKTEGSLQYRAMNWARTGLILTGALLVAILVTVLFSPSLDHLFNGLFTPLSAICLAGAVVLLGLVMANLHEQTPNRSFVLAAGAVLLLMLAFAGALYPMMVPPSMTVQQAASPDNMLRIMLYVIGAFLPLLIIYNAYIFHIFRGKAQPEH